MSQTTPNNESTTPQGNSASTNQTTGDPSNDRDTSSGSNARIRNNRRDTRRVGLATTQRDFKGSTPEIGVVLDLRSKNVSAKTNYDKFCEKNEDIRYKEF